MATETKYQVYVSVHKGDLLDSSKFRHTALWFVPEDDTSHYYYHVTGAKQDFAFERRCNFDPTTSQSFATKVELGQTEQALTASELTRQMESVVVANDNVEFNCQQWVDMALRRLREVGYLTAAQYDTGMNGMIDAIMEAEDDHLAY